MKHLHGAVALVNVAYGPWETKAWWHAMVGQANNLAKGLGPDDAWLLRVGHQITADKGFDGCPWSSFPRCEGGFPPGRAFSFQRRYDPRRSDRALEVDVAPQGVV